jgi:hypothetical protein
MKDVFYTLLVVWLIYRIVSALSATKGRNSEGQKRSKVGETTVSYSPPQEEPKRKYPNEGEYVDYEEIK